MDFVKQLDKLEFSGECKVKLSLKTNAIKSFGKTVENDIKSLEKVLNIKFPNDYKDFLLKTNGGSIPNDNTNEIVLKNIEKIINIDILYGVNTDNSCFDIEYWTKKYIDDLFEKTVIIGDSLQNGFIVMICDGNNDGVYYYDDSYYFDESNDENNVYIISNNLSVNYICLFNYLFISSQMSAKPYFIGSTGILLLW